MSLVKKVSILALTDGITVRPLLPAQDHKRIGVGDTGENTGGMGAYAPAPLVTPALMESIQRDILQPTVDALRQRGIDYRGILYAGLMITPSGKPTVLEFNCRFGDPETQAILPLLETPLEELLLACTQPAIRKIARNCLENQEFRCVWWQQLKVIPALTKKDRKLQELSKLRSWAPRFFVPGLN